MFRSCELAAKNIKFKILGVDFLVGAVVAKRLDCCIQLIAQIGIRLAHRHAGARTVAGLVMLVTTDKLEILAGIGFQKTVIRRD